MSSAQTAAQSAASSATSSTSSTTTTDPLASLGSNSTEFLTLLTTQLKNQDPSSPTSTDQLTTELAQFAGVEQQVSTNTNLSTLISLTQEEQMYNSQSLVGKTAEATTSTLPLQNGAAEFSFTSSNTDPVAIAIADSSGTVVKTVTMTPRAGTNTYTWDGTDNQGTTRSDGAYYVAIQGQTASGATSLTPTVTGTITGTSLDAGTVDIEMGGATIPMSSVISLHSATSSDTAATSAAAA
ncbi:basal-body rod modification protein FlgD [Ameyamaea chiangmaiensis NBRC 103196]|nr:basal-body rod modification protein FlgD [Ameyamaea chiangmaiensis NBRC 103196]